MAGLVQGGGLCLVLVLLGQPGPEGLHVVLARLDLRVERLVDGGETVAVEIVTYGPGLHMLRADTSPVKERIAPMALENPNLKFIACGNTQANQSKAEGKPVVVYSSEQSQVLCLAVGSEGSIYAGTGPNGQIVRIDPRGKGSVFSETGEAYVWSLAVDPKGQALYAGTGPHGRIYRINGEGKAAVFYTTRQEHILCVAASGDGMVYAGTDKGGLVYRIDPRGKGFVLYQANQAEVRALKVAPEAIYVGTSSPTQRRRGGGSGLASRGTAVGARNSDSAELVSDKKAKTDKKETATIKKSTASADREGGKSNSTPAPSTPASGENSVYGIALDGTVREVFREKAMVLSLLRQCERLFVGTGMDGQLFEVNEATRERSEIARLDHGQILCMCQRRDGSIVLGTGDPGKLYVLQDRFASRGSVLSDVLDAKIISKWGALRWEGATPEGTSVSVATRSGNVAEPDDTWSDWSAEQSEAEQAIIAAPTARFLQYRVTLTTQDPAHTPALHSLALRYMTTNQAPEVSSIQVPDLDAVNLENPKKIRFKWSATDPNEDDLSYNLYIRKDGWKNWVELEENLDRTEYEWDTTTTPSGIYQVKVVASDRKDNPAEEALTGERGCRLLGVVVDVGGQLVPARGLLLGGAHEVLDVVEVDARQVGAPPRQGLAVEQP